MRNPPVSEVEDVRTTYLRTYRYRRYFDAVVADVPPSEAVRRGLLVDYRYSVNDHLACAIASVAQLRHLGGEFAKCHTSVTKDADTGDFTVHIDDPQRANKIYRQIERELRTFTNEARAMLESLAYEVTTALVPLIVDSNGVTQEHKNLGIDTRKILTLLRGPSRARLRDYIVRIVGDDTAKIAAMPEYDRLHEMRNIGFHRRVIGPARAMNWVDLPVATVNVELLLPDNLSVVPFTHRENKTLLTFVMHTVSWLRQIADEIYRLATIAHRGYAQPTRRHDYSRRRKRHAYRGRSFIDESSLPVIAQWMPIP